MSALPPPPPPQPPPASGIVELASPDDHHQHQHHHLFPPKSRFYGSSELVRSSSDPPDEEVVQKLREIASANDTLESECFLDQFSGDWNRVLFCLFDSEPNYIFQRFENLKRQILRPLVDRGTLSFDDLWSLLCRPWTFKRPRQLLFRNLSEWLETDRELMMDMYELVHKGLRDGDDFQMFVDAEILRKAINDRSPKLIELLTESGARRHLFDVFSHEFNDFEDKCEQFNEILHRTKMFGRFLKRAFCPPTTLPSSFNLFLVCQCSNRTLTSWIESYMTNEDGLKEVFIIELFEFVLADHLIDYKIRIADYLIRNRDRIRAIKRLPRDYKLRFEEFLQTQIEALKSIPIAAANLGQNAQFSPEFLDLCIGASRKVLNGICPELGSCQLVGESCGRVLADVQWDAQYNDAKVRHLLVQVADSVDIYTEQARIFLCSCLDQCADDLFANRKFGIEFCTLIADSINRSHQTLMDKRTFQALRKLRTNAEIDEGTKCPYQSDTEQIKQLSKSLTEIILKKRARAMDSQPESQQPSQQRQITIPAETEGHVSFVFNNLNTQNTLHHAQFIRSCFANLDQSFGCIRPETWLWLARYIVMRRVPNEPNHQAIFVNFIDILGETQLDQMVTAESYKIAQTLLKSDRMLEKERMSLKHVGRWFGLYFLGRNRPVLARELDLKALITEALLKGPLHMEYAVPFVTSVFNSLYANAKPLPMPQFFYLPNPWTYGIFSALTDVFYDSSVTTPIRFDVEILFKHLQLDIETWPRAHVTKDDQLTSLVQSTRQQMCEKPSIRRSTIPESSSPQQQPPPAHLAPISSEVPLVDYSSAEEFGEGMFVIPPGLDRDFTETVIGYLIASTQSIAPLMSDQCRRLVFPVIEFSICHDLTLVRHLGKCRDWLHSACANLAAGLIIARSRDGIFNAFTNSISQRFGRSVPPDLVNSIISQNMQICMCVLTRQVLKKLGTELEMRIDAMLEFYWLRLEPKVRWAMEAICEAETISGLSGQASGRLQQSIQDFYTSAGQHIPGFKRGRGVLFENLALALDRIAQKMAEFAGSAIFEQLTQSIAKIDLEDVDRAIENVRSIIERFVRDSMREVREKDLEWEKAISAFVQAFAEFGGVIGGTGNQWLRETVTRTFERQLNDEPIQVKLNVYVLGVFVELGIVQASVIDSFLGEAALMTNNDDDDDDDDKVTKFEIMNAIQRFVKHCLLDHATLVSQGDLALCLERMYEFSVTNLSYRELTGEFVDILRINYDILNRNPDDRSTGSVYSTAVRILGHFKTGYDYGLTDKFNARDSYTSDTTEIFKEWVLFYKTNVAATSATTQSSSSGRHFNQFAQKMNLSGMFKTDDSIIRIFRVCIQVCVERAYAPESEQFSLVSDSEDSNGVFADNPELNRSLAIRADLLTTCDAFCELVATLIRNAGDNRANQVRVSLVGLVFGIVAGSCQLDHDTHPEFVSLTHQRILFSLLNQFTEISMIPSQDAPQTQIDQINFAILHSFMNSLYFTNPGRAPKFACQWLELLGNGNLIGKVFNSHQQKPPSRLLHTYAILLTVLIRFLEKLLVTRPDNPRIYTLVTFTTSNEQSFSKEFFTASIRLFLVLLHDFPEFTCDYYYELVDSIPVQFIQLRNMVLSAYFRQMPPPDPCADPTKLDLITQPFEPTSLAYKHDLCPKWIAPEMESLFSQDSSANVLKFIDRIRPHLKFEDADRYNLRAIASVVQHVGICFLNKDSEAKSNCPVVIQSPHATLLLKLAEALDDQGAYLLLTSIANQLRYPNGPTQFFSSIVLQIYQRGQAAGKQYLSEIVTRILTERLLVSRPHPWGVMLTFIELMRNPSYQLWQNNFIRWLPDIEGIFLNLNRSASRMPVNIISALQITANEPTTANSASSASQN